MTTTVTPTTLPVFPGARWWKIDFHAHSPASFDFGADEGSVATVKTSYRDWLLAYMRNGIDAIVVTDHNSHAGIDEARAEVARIRESAVDEFRELHVFAGVEITVDGGYHLLAVFDVDTPGEHVNGLLHKCKYEAERGSSLGTTKMSFLEVVEEIVLHNGLAIPAHVDGPKGLFEHDRRNQADLEKSLQIIAVETISGAGTAKALERDWVPILGSDAHHLDGNGCPEGVEAKYPGSHFTWVKMEVPNLSGLKLALSDGAQSVRPAKAGADDPNDFSHSVIERVAVFKDGVEAAYDFGPWMNTIIGGRGVGKSTIVELVRLAMGRFADLPEELQSDTHWFSPTPGRNATSRFWSSDTRIEVYISRSGERYRVVWNGSTPGASTIEVMQDGQWQEQGGSARDRFAMLINSQKQIYETARDPQSLLKAIDDQPQVAYVDWKETFDELCGKYRTQRSEIRELQTKIDSEDRVNGELSDIAADLKQIAKIRDSAEANELDRLTKQEQELSRLETATARFEQGLGELLEEFRDLTDATQDAESAGAWEAERSWRSSMIAGVGSVASALEALAEARKTWELHAAESPRRQRILDLKKFLDAPGAENAPEPEKNGEDPHEANARLLRAQAEREATLAEIEKAKLKISRQVTEAEATLKQIVDHRVALSDRRRTLAADLSGRDLKLQVLAQADDTTVERDLRQLLQKSNSFDQVFADDGLPSVLEHPFKPGRDKRIGILKSLLKELREHSAEAPSLKKYVKTPIDQRFFSHLATLDAHTFSTDVDLWFPEDRLRVQYKQDGDAKLREIDEGSPGEKTAALLAVVLQLSDDPLLLDQPEDDLDNKLIYDLVVSTLKRIKANRQVVVVTHNANVVVNADAEHVTILRHGKIPEVEVHGSIQVPQVKKSICLIMEGGESAFESRYKRLMQ